MAIDLRNKNLVCPHCGKPVTLEQLEEAASRAEEEKKPPDDRGGSVWDKKPAGGFGGWATKREADKPPEPAKPAPAFGAPRREDKPAEAKKRESSPSIAPAPAARKTSPPVAPAKSKEPAPAAPIKKKEPAPAAPAKKKESAPRVPVPGAEGVCVLDVLDTDPHLNPGQRETIRMIYSRFATNVPKKAPGSFPATLTVGDVLDTDPHINRGQKETIRTIYDRLAPKK